MPNERPPTPQNFHVQIYIFTLCVIAFSIVTYIFNAMQSIESALNPPPTVAIEAYLMEAPLVPAQNGDVATLDTMFPRRGQASIIERGQQTDQFLRLIYPYQVTAIANHMSFTGSEFVLLAKRDNTTRSGGQRHHGGSNVSNKRVLCFDTSIGRHSTEKGTRRLWGATWVHIVVLHCAFHELSSTIVSERLKRQHHC
eukprot:scaffold652_cov188-Chaetoceros_neogracile.AAC.15